MKYKLLIFITAFLSFGAFAQKGMINNGAIIKVSDGAVVRVTGDDYHVTTKTGQAGTQPQIELDGKIFLQGNWVNNASTSDVFINRNGSGYLIFDGNQAQTISGNACNFEAVDVNNFYGISLLADIDVMGKFVLNSGRLTLGDYNITLNEDAIFTGSFSTARMVRTNGAGAIIKKLGGTGSFTFPLGDINGSYQYSPATLNFTSVNLGTNPYFTLKVVDEKHPDNQSDNDYINRYWSLTSSGINSFSCNVSFTYNSLDIAGTESNLYGGKWDSDHWEILNPVTTSSNKITGTVSSFSDFTAGENDVLVPSIALSFDGTISEASESTEVITVDLSNDLFVASLTPANWTFNNLPEGVSVGDINKISDTQVQLVLSGNRTVDYDAHITDFEVIVSADELQYSDEDVSENTGVIFTATNDAESITMEDDDYIEEGSESGEEIIVTLTGGTFVSSLNENVWTISGQPAGISIGNVSLNSSTEAVVTLTGALLEDYDADIIDMTLTIAGSQIDDFTGTSLSVSSGVRFTAIDEPAEITIVHDGLISEAAENGEVITVTLSEDIFESTLTLSNWEVLNLPEGVSLYYVSRINNTTAELTLSGNRDIDFDSNITNIQVWMSGSELTQHSGTNLTSTNTVTITADNDTEILSIADDNDLNEAAETGEVLTVSLSGGTFVNPINSNIWTVYNLPEGVNVGSIVRVDATTVSITLSGNRTVDYDSDITDLELSVPDTQIDDYSGANLTATGVTFIADIDAEEITMSNNGLIIEGSESGGQITVNLTGGTFVSSLNSANWTLSGAPASVEIGAVQRIDETTAIVTLNNNTSEDYDDDITDASITISYQEIDDMSAGTVSVSSGVTFTAIEEALTIVMTNDNDGIQESFEAGDSAIVSISNKIFEANLDISNWTASNLPQGVTAYDVIRENDTCAIVIFAGNRTRDYDANITNASFQIASNQIADFNSVATVSTGLIFTADNDEEEIALSDNTINESNEDAGEIYVDLTGGTFATTLNENNWTVNNLPEGVSVESVTKSTSTRATIALEGNRVHDYDSHITNVEVVIAGAEIDDFNGVNISKNTGVTLIADIDNETLAISNATTINEGAENGKIINVVLAGGTFATTLNQSNWSLSDLPQNVTIGSVVRDDANNAHIVLSGNTSEDYDVDITTSVLTIQSSEINDVASGAVVSGTGAVFTADDETATIALSQPTAIQEENEDGKQFYVDLNQDTFAASLTTTNWTFQNLPGGVEVGQIERTSDTRATITLSGNRLVDYDANITNISVEIAGPELQQHDYTVSANTGLIFNAVNDNEEISMSFDSNVYEGSEDGSSITVVITGGTFAQSITPTNWNFAGFPSGVDVDNITRHNKDSVFVTLTGNTDIDYDVDITDASLSISASEIDDNNAGLSISTGLLFEADDELATAEFASIEIQEESENGAEIFVNLIEDEFVSPFSISSWSFNGLPEGVSVASVEYVNATQAKITLSGNRTVDYDADITDFSAEIGASQLVQHNYVVTATVGVTFVANNDDEILSLSFDGTIEEGFEDGEVITVTLSGGTFESVINPTNWSLSNLPGGVQKGDIQLIDALTAEITLSGNANIDYDADILNMGVSIPASDINDHVGNAITVNTGVVFTANDEPVVLTMTDNGIYEKEESEKKVYLTLEEDYFVTNLNQVNWTFTNLPQGVTVSNVQRTSATTATVNLYGNRTKDYDTDITDFTISFTGDELVQHDVDMTVSTGVVFNAVDDDESISMESDGYIEEAAEDGEEIRVYVHGGTFVNNLNVTNWSLSHLPTGVEIGSVSKDNDTTAVITLSGNRQVDFDVDITNINLTFTASEIDDYTGVDLTASGGVEITAIDEPVELTVSLPQAILEEQEDGAVVNVQVAEDEFVTTLTAGNWDLTGLPDGVVLDNVVRVNNTEANIYLSGTRTIDFDTDITNIDLSVSGDEFLYHSYTVDTSDVVAITAVNDDETIEIALVSEVFEGAEDGAEINVTLNGGTFINVLTATAWTVSGLPEGVSLGTVQYVNANEALITLTGNATDDFDTDLPLNVSVDYTQFDDATSGTISTQAPVYITAEDEQASISMTDDGINEGLESGEIITITLTEDEFVENVEISNWTFTGLPQGVEVGELIRQDSVTIEVVLSGNRSVDYDANITDFAIEITGDELQQHSYNLSIGTGVIFIADNDDEILTMQSDGLIEEGAESGEVITVELTGGTFVQDLNVSNWQFAGIPQGVSIGNLDRVDSATVEITFYGNRIVDYDVDITDASLTVDAVEVDDYNDIAFDITGITFTANIESSSLAISTASQVFEANESGTEIDVVLDQDQFVTTIDEQSWELSNLPSGVQIDTVERIDDTHATVILTGNRNVDYDTDISDIYLTISASEFVTATTNIVSDQAVTFTAEDDDEVITAAFTQEVFEGEEDYAQINVDITGGTFAETQNIAYWTLSGQPEGVEIGSVYRQDSSSVLIVLSGNTTEDYDTDITDAIISVSEFAFDDYTGADYEITNSLTFTAIVEPASIVCSVVETIAEAEEDGAEITVNVLDDEFVASLDIQNWSIAGLPQGVSFTQVTRVDEQTATLTLSGNRLIDFDMNQELTVSVSALELVISSDTTLVDNSIYIEAFNDPEYLAMSHSGQIMEGAESGSIINVSLSGGTFVETFTQSAWEISGQPQGVSLASVSRIDSVTAQIELTGNATVDYDVDITDMLLSVADTEIDDHTGDNIEVSTGVTFTAEIENYNLTFYSENVIDESNESGGILIAKLEGDEFAATLTETNWTISGLPQGVSVLNYNRAGNDSVRIELTGNRLVDYDSDINLSVEVQPEEFVTYDASLTASGAILTALDDEEVLSMTNTDEIEEGSEDGSIITVTLEGGTFAESLTAGNWSITNQPQGVSVAGVTYVDSVTVELELVGNTAEDYDVDITNMTLSVADTEIDDHSGFAITITEGVIFTAIDEPMSVTVNYDGEIIEGQESGEQLTVSLTDAMFSPILDNQNWVLADLPQGVILGDISRGSDTEVVISLSGNSLLDFDVDVSDISLTIPGGDIVEISNDTTLDLSIVIEALIESAHIYHAGLTDENLDGAVLDLELLNEYFEDDIIEISNFILNNVPGGTTLSDVSYVDSVSAQLTLAWDGTPFIDTIPDFFVTVAGVELHRQDSVNSDSLEIRATDVSVELIDMQPEVDIFTHSNVLNISIENAQFNDAIIKIYDITGKLLMIEQINKATLRKQLDFASGIYHVELMIDDKYRYVEKIKITR